MKASEILRRYTAGERDFPDLKNLEGQSFQGQNLSKANFSGVNIRGADFSGANLTGANFKGAKAGVRKSWFYGALILSGSSGLMVGFLPTWFMRYIVNTGSEQIVGWESIGWLSLGALIVFLGLAHFEGLGNAIWKTLLGLWSFTVLIAAFISVFWGQWEWGIISAEIAKTSLMGIIANAFGIGALTTASAILGNRANTIAGIGAIFGVLGVRFIAQGDSHKALVSIGIVGIAGCCLLALAIIGASTWIARQALAGEKKHDFIRTIAIMVAARRGTSFKAATLTGVDFSQANLKNTDFRMANLHHTRWEHAQNLELARLAGQILDNPDVLQLLVNRALKNDKSYENVDLRGADLTDLDLSYATFSAANFSEANLTGAILEGADLRKANLSKTDLTRANLTDAQLQDTNQNGAILHGACLEGALLTRTQAFGTDFTEAKFTGVCIEDWGIDWKTKLDEVDCRYVWLQEKPTLDTGQRKRSPESGLYKSRDFAKLHQQIRDTVEIFFNQGLNFKFLATALENTEVNNRRMSIQRMVDKGDGFVIIHLKVPPETDPAQIHELFLRNYDEAKRFFIGPDRKLIPKEPEDGLWPPGDDSIISIPDPDPLIAYLQEPNDTFAILELNEGNFKEGFKVKLELTKGEEGKGCIAKLPGKDKLNPENKKGIDDLYKEWRDLYRKMGGHRGGEFIVPKQEKNFKLSAREDELKNMLNQWLYSLEFRDIDHVLHEKFPSSDKGLVIIKSDNPQVQQIPWHLWQFVESHENTEVAFTFSNFSYSAGETREANFPKNQVRNQVRVLVILGDSEGIDVKEDKKTLMKLLTGADLVFLDKPNREKFHHYLWDDEQGFDILYFSGHSYSKDNGETGIIKLNEEDKVNLNQKKYLRALREVVKKGLQIAIFNSCDGLGLARGLASLYIPRTIVMRESVPDVVAQEFLKRFLKHFVKGDSLSLSVRKARDYLVFFEEEDRRYRCASWLPVIFLNPDFQAVTWQKLREKYT